MIRRGIAPNPHLGRLSPDELYHRLDESLAAEVDAAKHRPSAIELLNGERIDRIGANFIYRFPCGPSVKITDDTPVSAVIGEERITGTVVSVEESAVRIAFSQDVGDTLPRVTLSTEPTFLLERLREKLAALKTGGQLSSRLTHLLLGREKPKTHRSRPKIARAQLNDEQWDMVCLAEKSELLFLWGPPGTGKTSTLAAAAENMLANAGRLLVVSNTHKAVDSLLEPLCDRLAKGTSLLTEGRVIRIGPIASDRLKKEYGELISLDAVVERKGAHLSAERDTLRAEHDRLTDRLDELARVIKTLAALDRLQQQGDEAVREVARSRQRVRDAESECLIQQENIEILDRKLTDVLSVGFVRRLFKTSPDVLREQIRLARSRLSEAEDALKRYTRHAAAAEREHLRIQREYETAASPLSTGTRPTRSQVNSEIDRSRKRRAQLDTRLRDIEAALSRLRTEVLSESRVIATTISKLSLLSENLGEFDTVIVDEASMVLFPAVLYVATCAKSSLVIAGDFRQLGPIVATEDEGAEKARAREVLLNDVFVHAGIVDAVDSGIHPPSLIQLAVQYRMDDRICAIIRDRYYNGRLKTGRAPSNEEFPYPFTTPVLIVDTAKLGGYASRPGARSRINLRHLQLIGAILSELRAQRWFSSGRRLSAISPYRAQANSLHQLAADLRCPEVEAGTVHQFQGNERDAIIFDLTDAFGVKPSPFLTAAHIEETGGRLLNVAVSRARDRLLILADLRYFRRELLPDSLFAELLFRRELPVICASEIWNRTAEGRLEAMRLVNDLSHSPELGPITLLHERNLIDAICTDIAGAKRQIIIVSAYCTSQGVSRLAAHLEAKCHDGCTVRAVVGRPGRASAIPAADTREAISVLQKLGAIVDIRDQIHEKCIAIDGEVLYLGSPNPLSFTTAKTESMMRTVLPSLVHNFADSFIIRSRPSKALPAEAYRRALLDALARRENPACPKCKAMTVLNPKSTGEPQFYCDKECGWSAPVRSVREERTESDNGSGKADDPRSQKEQPGHPNRCAECGAGMVERTGPFGTFWGCARYPNCRYTEKRRGNAR